LGVNGPIKVALIKNAGNGTFILKIAAKGALGPGPQPHIMVVPPAPGTNGGMKFTINGGDSYCVNFGGAAGGAVTNAPSTGTVAFQKVFNITSKTMSPTSEAGCPTPAVSTTSTTSTSTTTSMSTTSTTLVCCETALVGGCDMNQSVLICTAFGGTAHVGDVCDSTYQCVTPPGSMSGGGGCCETPGGCTVGTSCDTPAKCASVVCSGTSFTPGGICGVDGNCTGASTTTTVTTSTF